MNNVNIKLIFLLLLVFAATLFLIQNTHVAKINILFWSYSMSVSLVIISMLIIGILFGWFLKSYINHKQKKKAIKEEKLSN